MDINDDGKKIKGVRIQSNAGYGLLAMTVADVMNVPAYIIPMDDKEGAYYASKNRIWKSFADGKFCQRLNAEIPFGLVPGWIVDPIKLVDQISPEFWCKIRDFCFSHQFGFSEKRQGALVVPSKILTETSSGVTGELDERNLSWASLRKQNFSNPIGFFAFLRNFSCPYTYMGNFDKQSSEVDNVFRFAVFYNMEIPGEKTDGDLFGVRDAPLLKFNQFYASSRMLINVVNTTTWHALLYYPMLPQIIYYPENSKEPWELIAGIWGDHILALSIKDGGSNLEELQRLTIKHMDKYL